MVVSPAKLTAPICAEASRRPSAAADAGPETDQLLRLVHAAIIRDEALAITTIRSDAFSLMQGAPALEGVAVFCAGSKGRWVPRPAPCKLLPWSCARP
jgi:hypothetical protein